MHTSTPHNTVAAIIISDAKSVVQLCEGMEMRESRMWRWINMTLYMATIAYIKVNQTRVRPFSRLFNLEHSFSTTKKTFHRMCLNYASANNGAVGAWVFFSGIRWLLLNYHINLILIFRPISIFNDLKCIAHILNRIHSHSLILSIDAHLNESQILNTI